MLRRTIHIPIYDCKVVVILAPDVNEHCLRIYRKHAIEHEGGEVYAEVIAPEESIHLYYILLSTDYLTLNLFVHEITHLGGLILGDRGHSVNDDEPLAYLNGHLAEQIHKIMLRNNIDFIQKPKRTNGQESKTDS